MFSFEISADVVASSSASNGSSILKGGRIHKVKLLDVREESIDIKEKDGRPAYRDTILTITVGNDEGTFTEKFFSPNEKSMEARQSNAGKPQPTLFQQTQNKITQYLIAFRPKLMEEIKAGTKKFEAKTWADFRKLVVKSLQPAIGKGEVFFKLLKNNSGYAQIPPFPAAMAEDKDNPGKYRVFTGSIFIHTDEKAVYISDWEQEGLDRIANARPNTMPGKDDDGDLGANLDDDDDLDLDDVDDLPF